MGTSPHQGAWRPRCPLGTRGPPESSPPPPQLCPQQPQMRSGESRTVPPSSPPTRTQPKNTFPFQDPLLRRSRSQFRAKRRPRIPGETCPPRRRAPASRAARGGRERTEHTRPRHPLGARSRFQAVRPRVTASPPPPPARSRRRDFWPPGGSAARTAADPWDPPRELQPFTCAPAAVGDSGAQHRARGPGGPGGGAVGTSAAAVPCSAGPAGRYLSGGPAPAPAPAPAGVLGNRSRYARPREPPPSAPAELRGGGGHMEEGSRPPPLGSTFSLSSSREVLSRVLPHSTHTPLASLRGTLASLNRLGLRGLPGEGGGGGEDGGGKAGGGGAAPALAAPRGAGPSRPGGGRALPGPRAGPGATKAVELGTAGRAPSPRAQERARSRCAPPPRLCPSRPSQGPYACGEIPGSRDEREWPLVSQALGATRCPSVRSCILRWQSIQQIPETRAPEFWSRCSWAESSEDAKCCPTHLRGVLQVDCADHALPSVAAR